MLPRENIVDRGLYVQRPRNVQIMFVLVNLKIVYHKLYPTHQCSSTGLCDSTKISIGIIQEDDEEYPNICEQ
jgi:hypothetical protein